MRSKPELVVLVPVLMRPHRVGALISSVMATTPEASILFIPDPDDTAEREAIRAHGAEELPVEGGYARKINAGVRATTEPLIFLGADDLAFKADWFARAKLAMVDKIGVVGINDLVPRRRNHATHFLLTRAYAELPTIDGGPGPLHEGYNAWYCDDELIATARHRDAYAYTPFAEVEHLHPMAGKSDEDAVYRRGRRLSRHDRMIFAEREALWT
jgi:hypothetical protein